MKFFNLANGLGLVSLFFAFTSAGITISEMPYQVHVGLLYEVEYTSDRNHSIIDFQVMQWSDSEKLSWRSGEMVNHYINIDAGHSRVARWKAPNVESGVYDFFLNAIEIDENGELNPNTTFYVRSNKFEIVGGRAPLRPIQIAGITVGSVAAVILLAVIWAVCARLWRQRRSLAVDLSEHNEGGYTDNAGR